MKKITPPERLKELCFFLLFCAFASVSFGQQAYKGRLHVSGTSFQRQGPLLCVHMQVSYGCSSVRSGRFVAFTPVIRKGTLKRRLSPAVINGERREKAERRAEVLGGEIRRGVPTVLRESRRSLRSFTYESSVPYEEWMKDGSLYVESQECSCGGRPGRVFEDLLRSSLSLSDPPLSSPDPQRKDVIPFQAVRFIKPGKKEQTLCVRGTLPFFGRDGIWHRSLKKFNRSAGLALREKVSEGLSREGSRLSSVRLNIIGAPVGNYRRNEITSMKRALSLKKYLMERGLRDCNTVEVNWKSEDWDSISSLVRYRDMVLKEAVLNVIGTMEIGQGRERELQRLDRGLPYWYLKTRIFPLVCRIEYMLDFSRAYPEGGENTPEEMSLETLYGTAGNYYPGSREFDDLMDLSARLFPGSAEARINAAGVSLLRGDAPGARKNLEDLMTDPRAYNNLGLLYLLEGNFEKSEVYLRIAESAGVSQAEEGLKLLEKQKRKKEEK